MSIDNNYCLETVRIREGNRKVSLQIRKTISAIPYLTWTYHRTADIFSFFSELQRYAVTYAQAFTARVVLAGYVERTSGKHTWSTNAKTIPGTHFGD